MADNHTAHSPKHRHPIVVFDSGIGGLSVVDALRHAAPSLIIDFLADTAFFPYGLQDDARLRERVITLMGDVIEKIAPSIIVIACNTASTLTLELLRKTYPDQIFVGCIPPLRLAARLSQTKTIGLIATPATMRRKYVATLQARYAPDCTVLTQATPHLAGYAERLFRGEVVHARYIKDEIGGLFQHPQSKRMDVIGIGCTHYSFLRPLLEKSTPHRVKWADPSQAVARHCLHVLNENFSPRTTSKQNTPQYFWTTAHAHIDEAFQEHLAKYHFCDIKRWPRHTTR